MLQHVVSEMGLTSDMIWITLISGTTIDSNMNKYFLNFRSLNGSFGAPGAHPSIALVYMTDRCHTHHGREWWIINKLILVEGNTLKHRKKDNILVMSLLNNIVKFHRGLFLRAQFAACEIGSVPDWHQVIT